MLKSEPYPRFLRFGRVVHDLYGISRSAQYELIQKGKLRPPRKISPQLQGWLREELEEDLFGSKSQVNGSASPSATLREDTP